MSRVTLALDPLRRRRMPLTSTRDACAKSWVASQRLAEQDGIVRMTAASMVGHLLEVADGDVVRAVALVPKSRESAYWARCFQILESILAEERDTQAVVVSIRRDGR